MIGDSCMWARASPRGRDEDDEEEGAMSEVEEDGGRCVVVTRAGGWVRTGDEAWTR